MSGIPKSKYFDVDGNFQRLLMGLSVLFCAFNGIDCCWTIDSLNDAGMEFAHIFECMKLVHMHIVRLNS